MITKIDLKFEEDVYKKYYPLVYSTCRRFLHKQDVHEDAVQSVFLLYIKKEDSINSNLSSWFYWASVNICKVVNMQTKKQAEKFSRLNENTDMSKNDESNTELFSSLSRELEKLPTKKREMLLMRYYDNLSYREIGSYFKCKEDSARKIIERTVLYLEGEIKRKEVLSSIVFAQFFGLNSPSAITLSTSKFIIQNSLLQQSFVNSLQKIILISKLKMGLLIFAGVSFVLGIPFSAYYLANNKQPISIIDKNVAAKVEEKKEIQTPIENTKPISLPPAAVDKPMEKNEVMASPMPAGKWVLFYDKADLSSKYIAITLEINKDGSVVFRSKKWAKEIPVTFISDVRKPKITFEVGDEIFEGEVSIIDFVHNNQKMAPYIQAIGTVMLKDNKNEKQEWFIQNLDNLKHGLSFDMNLW